MTQEKLSVTDWLQAAFRALTKGGPSAIKAEAIARDLGVSKGSFYWHFKNVPTLKSDMLSHWLEGATQSIIAELDQATDSPQDKLRCLISISTSDLDTPYGGAMVEAAIRDWARYDEAVSSVLEKVDAARIEYDEGLFNACDFTKEQSRVNAQILYAALVGLQMLSTNGHVNPSKNLSALLEILLS